jgi:hypothetical protein
MPPLHQKWAEQQLAALLEIGTSLAEAEAAVQWVLRNIPQGEDPATWLPGPEVAPEDAQITQSTIQDARTDWYARETVPNWAKRLLDARDDETMRASNAA